MRRQLLLPLLLFLGLVIAECDVGTYGDICQYSCTVCELHGICTEGTSGGCVCDVGFDGSECGECSNNFEGDECDECISNFTGENCDECAACYMGESCEINCNCAEHTTCINGECRCLPGFVGDECSTPIVFNLPGYPNWSPLSE